MNQTGKRTAVVSTFKGGRFVKEIVELPEPSPTEQVCARLWAVVEDMIEYTSKNGTYIPPEQRSDPTLRRLKGMR